MNKAFQTPGPPRIKPDYGLISDLMKGVPVEVVRKRYKVSRGTVYRMIREHPELAKMWEPKFKKWEERRAKKGKQPDPASTPVPDPLPAQPTEPPLPEVLLRFLASHRPKIASPIFPVEIQRTVLWNLLSQLGLLQEDEYDALTDEELVVRVTAYQGNSQSQPDEVRLDEFQVETNRG